MDEDRGVLRPLRAVVYRRGLRGARAAPATVGCVVQGPDLAGHWRHGRHRQGDRARRGTARCDGPCRRQERIGAGGAERTRAARASCRCSSISARVAANLALADEVIRRGGKLDVLVNNIGMLDHAHRLNPEGFEATYALNLLGHFALTEALHRRGTPRWRGRDQHGVGRFVQHGAEPAPAGTEARALQRRHGLCRAQARATGARRALDAA